MFNVHGGDEEWVEDDLAAILWEPLSRGIAKLVMRTPTDDDGSNGESLYYSISGF